MSFFIIGLPRSRTAWLANFMTYDGLYCHHEGMNNCNSIAEYKDKIGEDGDSSTGLMLFDLKKHFPDRKILIIESNPNQARQYMDRIFGGNNTQWVHSLKARLDDIQGLRVKYDDINDNLQIIWEYLTDKPYDSKRGKLIKGFNVQTDISDMNVDSAINIYKEAV